MSATVGYVELTLTFSREEGKWVGLCDELGVSTYGKKLEQVEDDLRLLVIEFLNLLEESGERERLFRERKIQVTTAEPTIQVVQMPHRSISETNRQYFRPGVFKLPGGAPVAPV